MKIFDKNLFCTFERIVGYSDKKHYHGLTCAEMSPEKSKANAQGANIMSRKIGRDSHSNWWATDVTNML